MTKNCHHLILSYLSYLWLKKYENVQKLHCNECKYFIFNKIVGHFQRNRVQVSKYWERAHKADEHDDIQRGL